MRSPTGFKPVLGFDVIVGRLTDAMQPYPNREEILDGAPDRDGEFFKVPKIVNTGDA